MRLGELLGLRWCDVDLDMASLSVVQSLYKRCGVCKMIEPKTSHSRRRIAMSPSLALLLRKHKADQQVESPSGITVPQLPLVFQTLFAFVTLFILAAISFPHEGYTRYPDMAIKPEEYTMDLGIVRALPKMAKMLEKENRKLMELISQSS